MKLPKTTKDKPYIEYRFTKSNKLVLKASSTYWGSKSGFVSSDGSSGNTCLPKDLNKSMKAFKDIQVKYIEREIKALQKKLNTLTKHP